MFNQMLHSIFVIFAYTKVSLASLEMYTTQKKTIKKGNRERERERVQANFLPVKARVKKKIIFVNASP